MTMTFRFPGSDVSAYRAQTERQSPMPGVTRPSFRCQHCGQFRGTQGRQKTSAGWRCHACRPKEGV